MKNSGLIIAAVVLAALLGTLYWSNRHKPVENSLAPTTPAEASPKILTLNEGDVIRLELKKKASDPVVLIRNTGGPWHITAPKEMVADQAAVAGVVSTISSLDSDRLVEEKAANLIPYGLATPALEVTITDKNNVAHKLLIGDDTPTRNATYAKLDGDSRVFTIASFSKTGIDKNLDDLLEKKVFAVNDPSKIEIREGEKKYGLTKTGEDWLSADGKKYDKGKAQAFVDSLRDLRATEFAETGFGATALEVTVTSGDGKKIERVLFSKGSKNPVAKRAGETTLYTLDATALENLQKLVSELKLETPPAK
jgi:hypothetical protein